MNISFPFTPDKIALSSGWGIEIAPNIVHQFEAVSDCTIVESYYTCPIDISYLDIQRIVK